MFVAIGDAGRWTYSAYISSKPILLDIIYNFWEIIWNFIYLFVYFLFIVQQFSNQIV